MQQTPRTFIQWPSYEAQIARYQIKRARAEKKGRPTCSAINRLGLPCLRKPAMIAIRGLDGKIRHQPLNGACELHGGLSTGPRSDEGKEISMLNIPRVAKKINGIVDVALRDVATRLQESSESS